ncbi:MAG: hypothetical protein BWK77_06635 [Verrucomicrobia bacterium A1]|nr:MAG: hypothetical protein BWK77_06635 [Verrucomicrobia bacterium A1]
MGVPYYTEDGRAPETHASDPRSKIILMVGAFYHRPNREGLEWFLRSVWPLVRRACPDAQFRVVGSGLTDAVKAAFGGSNADFAGSVPDIGAEYANCAITVAPILSGAGINVKVFESLVHGRVSVVSAFAHRGYEECLPEGESLLVGRDPAGFAAACAELLGAPERRNEMAMRGRDSALQAFSFERFCGVVDETLSALEEHRP